jgi:DNA polymerase V
MSQAPQGELSHALIPFFMMPVAAGFPSPADDFMEPGLDFNQYLIRHPAATYCLRVSGESMLGAGIHNGDLLVIDKAIPPEHGKVVIASLDGRFTCKRLIKDKGRYFLFADNETFKPIALTDGNDWEVWGVATYVIHRL